MKKLKLIVNNNFKKRDKETVLLATGDPLWFGIGRYLLNHFPSDQ